MTLNNAEVRFEVVDVEGGQISVAIPHTPNRCWLTSLCTSIGPMARQEIDREMQMPIILGAKMLSAVFEGLGRLFRIDDVVFPEHRLLTTSLYRRNQLPGLVTSREKLAARYPDKAIVIRSLNARDHADYIDKTCWPFRMVWIVDDVAQEWMPRRDAIRDFKLQAQLNLKTITYGNTIPDGTLADCIDLYHGLYLGAYSVFNPDYDISYLKLLLNDGALEILTLEDDSGHIEAFCALHICEDTLSIPLLGYNQKRPRADGLYRAIMALAARAADLRGLRMNLSAGASRFKRHRGAKPCMEYLLIMDRHLPFWRRWGYTMIGMVLRQMAPVLERTVS